MFPLKALYCGVYLCYNHNLKNQNGQRIEKCLRSEERRVGKEC